ncbi:MAG: DUF1735 domain-containing protein [Alistipes finegoldii]
MNNILGLLRTSALCLTLAVMAACDAEDFTRTAGDIPGKDDLANVGGVLRREKTPDQISALKLGEEQTTTDAVFYQLTQPAAVDVTVTVDADATLVDEYNKDKQGDAKLALFPLEKVTFEEGKTVTVKRGENLSCSCRHVEPRRSRKRRLPRRHCGRPLPITTFPHPRKAR